MKKKNWFLLLIVIVLLSVSFGYIIGIKSSHKSNKQAETEPIFKGYGFSVNIQYPIPVNVSKMPDSTEDLLNIAFYNGDGVNTVEQGRYTILIKNKINTKSELDAYVRDYIKTNGLGSKVFIETKSINIGGIDGVEYKYSYNKKLEESLGSYDNHEYISAVIRNSKAYLIIRSAAMLGDYLGFRSSFSFL